MKDQTSKAERTRHAILELLTGGAALSADALARELALSILYVRPRVSELVSQQRLVPSGERARNASGKWAHKWMAA